MIKKRVHIVLEVHEDRTDIHCGPFMSDTVLGDGHEQRAREMIPLMLNEMDFFIDEEKNRIKKAKKSIFGKMRLVK